MAWFGSTSEWKQGLSYVVLGKVEELENLNEKLKREKNQKQSQLDTLQQSLDKQKRKTDDEIKLRQSLAKENEHLSRSCEQLQEKLRGGSDHSLSLPLPQIHLNSSVNFDIGSDKLKQKKIEELESENRILHEKIKNISSKEIIQTPVKASTSDDFWSHFSQQQIILPQKSPLKTTVKKALETSEGNPFKAPPVTPFKKGMEVSDENPFKTPLKYTHLSTPSTSSITLDSKDSYISQLEKKVSELTNQLLEIKNQVGTNSTTTSNNISREINPHEIKHLPLKYDHQVRNSEVTSAEKCFSSTCEECAVSKQKVEDAFMKLEKSENKLKQLQSELECQRHNSETSQKRLEDSIKEKEREFNTEMSRSQSEIAATDQKVKELSIRLQQQETLAMNTQNILQASLDKIKLQLTNAEKEKALTLSRCGQLETSVNQYEKFEEDGKKLVTQLKRDKEMNSAQVESLKLKLAESEMQLNRGKIQLDKAEQVNIELKNSLQEMLDNHKSSIEKERESFNRSAEVSRTENEKRSLEDRKCISQLESKLKELGEELKTLTSEKCEALQKMEENCEEKLKGVHMLEAKITELKMQVSQMVIESTCKEAAAASELEQLKANKDLEIKNLRSSAQETLQQTIIKHKNDTEKLKEDNELQIKQLLIKYSELEKSFAELQALEELARGEKLAAELSVWELEGKLESIEQDLKSSKETILLEVDMHITEKNKLFQETSLLENTIFEKNSEISALKVNVDGLIKICNDFKNTIKLHGITIEGAQAEIKSKEEQLVEVLSQLTNCQEDLSEKTMLLDQLSSENLKFTKLKDDMSSEFKFELEVKEQKIKAYEEKLKEMKSETEKYKQEHDNLVTALEKEHFAYKTHLNELENVKLRSEFDIDSLKKEVSDLSYKLSAAEILNKVNFEMITDLNIKINEKKNLILELKSTVEILKVEIAQLNADTTKDKEESTNEINKLNTELTNMKDFNKSLEEQIVEKNIIMRESETSIERLQLHNKEMLAEMTILSDSVSSTTSQLQQNCEDLSVVKVERNNFENLCLELQKNKSDLEIELKNIQDKFESKLSIEQFLSKKMEIKLKKCLSELEDLRTNNSLLLKQLKDSHFLCTELEIKKNLLFTEKENLAKELQSMQSESIPFEKELKLKENQLLEAQRGTLEIREEFDKKNLELNENLEKLKHVINEKENYISQFKSKYLVLMEKFNQCEKQLHKEKLVSHDMIIDYGCYKEVTELMRRETILNDSEDNLKICMEKESLQDNISELKYTIHKLTMNNLTLQKVNRELKTNLVCDGNEKYSDVSNEASSSIETNQDIANKENFILRKEIASLVKERDEKESEVVVLGEKLQDLLAELDQLQQENKNLKLTLKHSEVVCAKAEKKEICEPLEDLIDKENKLICMELTDDDKSLVRKLKELQEKLNSFEAASVETSYLKSKELAELNEELISINDTLKSKNQMLVEENENISEELLCQTNQIEEIKRQNDLYKKKIDDLLCLQEESELDFNKENCYANVHFMENSELALKTNDHICKAKETSGINEKTLSETIPNIDGKNLEMENFKCESIIETMKSDFEQLKSKNDLYIAELKSKCNEKNLKILNELSKVVHEKDETIAALECSSIKFSSKTNEFQNLESKILCLEKSEKELGQEKEQLSSKVDDLVRLVKEKEMECFNVKGDFIKKCAKFSVLEISNKELQNNFNKKENELLELSKEMEGRLIDYKTLKEKWEKLSEDFKAEKQNHQSKCNKINEYQKTIERYKENVEGLKAKFVINQRNIVKKDNEIKQSLEVNTSLKKNIRNLDLKLKEEGNKTEQLKSDLSDLNALVKEKEGQLVKQIELHTEVSSKLNDAKNYTQNLKQKMCRLQVQNKNLQSEISKVNKKPFLNFNSPEKKRVDFIGFDNESQSSGEVVEGSQPERDLLEYISSIDHFIPLRGRKRGRRSHCMRKTTTSPVLHINKERHKIASQKEFPSTSNDSKSTAGVKDFKFEILVDSPQTPRRVTRLSSSRENIESSLEIGKRPVLFSDNTNLKRQKLTVLKDSKVEGLPCKTEKGLNDIPLGLDSPGVMRRSTTTPIRRINESLMSPRGPLRLLDANFSLINPSHASSVAVNSQLNTLPVLLPKPPSTSTSVQISTQVISCEEDSENS